MSRVRRRQAFGPAGLLGRLLIGRLESRRAWRVRRTLVIAQMALSCVLLVGAGLLARPASVLMREDHGFQPSGALEPEVVLSEQSSVRRHWTRNVRSESA